MPELFQSLENRNPKILLQFGLIQLSLSHIQLNLFWIFYRFDFDETLDWLLQGPGEIFQGMNFLPVYFCDGQITHVVVSDSPVNGQNLTQDHDTATTFRE